MSKMLEKVMDAVDLETFIVAKNEEEGRKMALSLMRELGFKDVDLVFIQFQGAGVRVRLRGYVYKPGDQYKWLLSEEE
ncbi:hypothetical protein [Thermovenabulum sp.]|uniref:hypothetical protein n=1 Tax=Thermovenabulum sp. TaxID=3100335 RepID=UPI003C7EA859